MTPFNPNNFDEVWAAAAAFKNTPSSQNRTALEDATAKLRNSLIQKS
ncbi:MAG: hypothetical protein AAGL29_07230 [Bacteroidota bacterium]